MPLGIFLGKMQELHNETRPRVKHLEQGAPPRPRQAAYIPNDRDLELARQTVQLCGSIRHLTQQKMLSVLG